VGGGGMDFWKNNNIEEGSKYTNTRATKEYPYILNTGIAQSV
jgi:hypothetical protein